MASHVPAKAGSGSAKPSSVNTGEGSGIIDVDAIPSTPSPPSFAGMPGNVPVDEVIDVDDPDTCTRLSPPSAAMSSGNRREQPAMKFGGELGKVLYAQKTEVLEEEAAAVNAASVAAGAASAIAPSAALSPAATGPRVTTLGEAVAVARSEIISERAEQLNMPWPPTVAGASAAGPSAMPEANVGQSDRTAAVPEGVAVSTTPVDGQHASPRPRKMARVVGSVAGVPSMVAMPAVSRGRSRSKCDNRLRQPRKVFVRKAAVMSAVPRMVAGPPTPPPSGTGSGSGDHESSSGAGPNTDSDDRDFGAEFDADVSDDGGDNRGDAGDHVGDIVIDQDDIAGAGATGDDVVVSRTEKRKAGDSAAAGTAAASDELARQLAARSRNPRIFPAACWIPGAHAVLSAARAPRHGLPPVAPAAVPAGASMGMYPINSPEIASTMAPLPSSSMQSPGVAGAGEESSDEMDDDALVMAYVTPPASPAPVMTPTVSPARPRSSSGPRRRADDPRSIRAAAAATAAAVSGAAATPAAMQSDVTLRNLYDAVRNGFSSVRRELTRMRAEVVIAKSQAASTLRRMDGIAVAMDGREVGTGEVLGRLGELDKALRAITERITIPRNGDSGDQATGKDSLALMVEIKVRSIICDVLLLLPRACGPHVLSSGEGSRDSPTLCDLLWSLFVH